MLSLLSPGSLANTAVSNLGAQHWNHFNALLGHPAASMTPLQMDAMTAEQAVAACGSAGLGGLSDTFGTLDLVAAAAANGLGAAASTWPSSAAGGAAAGSTSLSAALAAISLGLPAPQLSLGADMGFAGQINAANLALATAAQQQQQQQQKQQQIQEMMTAVLLHQQLQQQQQQRQQQQQQHRQAMWAAAFNAAANVGLDDYSAAACANAAVQSTAGADNHMHAMATAGATTSPIGATSVADNSQLMQVSNHHLQLAGVQDTSQLLMPAAAFLQQQQQAGMHNMVREGYMGGVKGYAGQSPLQIPVAATAGNAGGFLM